MKHIKGNPMNQHVKVLKGRPHMSKTIIQPISAIPSGIADHMIVCNMFDQYKLTEDAHTYKGMCLPERYSSNTYGRHIATGRWFRLVMDRDMLSGRYSKWYWKWRFVETSDVPPHYQTAALLLS